MNGIEALLAVLVVYGIRDGVIAWWLIHRLIGSGGAVVAGSPPVAPAVVPPAPAKPVPAPAVAVGKPSKRAPRFTGITATSFAGADDSISSRTSAYDGKIINGDTELAAALAFHFPGKPPTIRAFYRRTGRTVDIPDRDVGPWNTNDPYWETNTRPQAETYFKAKHALPSGPNKGRVPSNPSGIDLSPAAWAALGYVGDPRKAQELIDWDFVDYLDGTATQAASEPAWMTLARAEIGFHEQPNNTGIGKYITLAGYGAEGDPWCAIFAGAMLRKAGIDITGCNAMARSFATSPAFTKLAAWQKGCIAVFWRGSPTGSEGHVGFADSEDATHVQTLGGNENDQVMIEPLPINGSSMGLLGYYWPVSSSPGEPKLT